MNHRSHMLTLESNSVIHSIILNIFSELETAKVYCKLHSYKQTVDITSKDTETGDMCSPSQAKPLPALASYWTTRGESLTSIGLVRADAMAWRLPRVSHVVKRKAEPHKLVLTAAWWQKRFCLGGLLGYDFWTCACMRSAWSSKIYIKHTKK